VLDRKLQNRIVILILVVLVCIYNGFLYFNKNSSTTTFMSKSSINGEDLWQKNNCAACHQLYGLGGYLGPDLTNIISDTLKGDKYVAAFLNSGTKSMPKFHFSEREKEEIVAFLTHVDKTGFYPNKNARIRKDGWVEIEYK
jgi:nitric oxide reductase subunit C